MKKVGLWLLVIVVIFAISFVVLYLIDMDRIENNRPVVFSTWGYDYVPPVGDYSQYQVQYVRTDGYNEGVKYPIVSVINSRNELDRYYNSNKEKYNLERNEFENNNRFFRCMRQV